MQRKKIFLILLILGLFSFACGLPSTAPEDAVNPEKTSVAQTVEAISGNGTATARPSKTPQGQAGGNGAGNNGSGNNGSASQRPTPTMLPTRPAPTSNANSAPSSAVLSIGNLVVSPTNTVYYGNCLAGEETQIHVEVPVTPLDQVKEVRLWVDISNQSGFVYADSISMWQLGIGDYAGDIDIGQIAPSALSGIDGTVTLTVEAVNKDGIGYYSNSYSLSVWYCIGGVVVPPPTREADIRSFQGPATVTAGDTVMLTWEVVDACKVFLDGVEVNAVDSYMYTVPSNEGDTTYLHTLTAWGDSCDNSTEKTAQVSIDVSAAGGGNASVRFVNQSSHPIVELQIDGTEMILSEAQTILSGGYLDVTVSAGNHTYAPGAGFWSGGVKNAIYPLPGGSFNDTDGTVTIYDPSITQIMTEYGSGGYFGGTYWDGTTPHCAAFNFNSDGSFDFYIDGNWNDSGSYSLIQRQPSVYGVEFNVTNSAGTESFIGTYYYSGASAGLMYMNNGPAGWEQIEYVLNGGC